MRTSVYKQLEMTNTIHRLFDTPEFRRTMELARALVSSPAMKAQQELSRTARAILDSPAMKAQLRILEQFRPWEEMQRRMARTTELAAEGKLPMLRCWAIMAKLGWPPPMEVTIADSNQFVVQYDEGGLDAIRDSVEALILDIYDRAQLARMVEKWESRRFLASRMLILREAVDAHLDGKYRLSIPALIPQVEGIIAQCFAHKDRLQGKHLKKYAATLLPEAGHGSFTGACDAAAKEFLVELLWEQFHLGDDIPLLSRHAILHGADTTYGTVANSLRVILLLDYLISQFRLVSIETGRSYHVVGCSAVRGKPNPLFYDNPAAARATGKVPCKRCQPDKAINLG